MPLLLGADGERLAKRHGDVTLSERRALGQSPQQVLGELAASLGIWPAGEPATAAELLERDLRAPARQLPSAGGTHGSPAERR